MEQKKNLEESGLPAEAVMPTTPTSSDETFLTEDELRNMPMEDMVALCRDNSIEITSEIIMGGKQALFNHLMSTFGV